jgi:hypothetical protein
MKVNIFVQTSNGGKYAGDPPHQTITGLVAEGACDAGDEIITAIDESRMSPKQVTAQRFLKFLASRRLSIEKLKDLSVGEQARLKEEFLLGE